MAQPLFHILFKFKSLLFSFKHSRSSEFECKPGHLCMLTLSNSVHEMLKERGTYCVMLWSGKCKTLNNAQEIALHNCITVELVCESNSNYQYL